MDPLTHKMKGIINLDEDEESVLAFDDDESPNLEVNDDHCLLARVLTRKPVYLTTLQKQMKTHWDGRFPCKITEKETDLFMLSFGCEGDMERVLTQETWHFQNHHIVLKKPSALQNLTPTDLKFSPFWVQVYRLPFLSKSRGLAKALGNIIGEFLEVFTDSLNEGWGPFLRIRVNLDVTKPLRRGRNIRLQQVRDKFWVDFRYERLPEWCMECGCLGHPYQKCATFLELIDNGIEPDLAYGPAIKGAPLPSSGYDRYRTDFSKGHAWPLVTRLARKAMTSTIPDLSIRGQPQPKKLFYGESSDQHNDLLQDTPIHHATDGNPPQSHITQSHANVSFSFAPATLSSASLVRNHAMMTEALIRSNVTEKNHAKIDMLPSITESASGLMDTHNLNQFHRSNQRGVHNNGLLINSSISITKEVSPSQFAGKNKCPSIPNPIPSSPNESDLSEIFMPHIGPPLGYIATYPPDTTNSNVINIAPKFADSPVYPPIISDSTICRTTAAPVGKENQSPNRSSKRLPESISLRKALKRCRGLSLATSNSELSTDAELNRISSEAATDLSVSFDNIAEAASQPRNQP
ncbi:hypothetical protein CsatB_014147 [Cannabis sativa]